jgi:hypothetical protein
MASVPALVTCPGSAMNVIEPCPLPNLPHRPVHPADSELRLPRDRERAYRSSSSSHRCGRGAPAPCEYSGRSREGAWQTNAATRAALLPWQFLPSSPRAAPPRCTRCGHEDCALGYFTIGVTARRSIVVRSLSPLPLCTVISPIVKSRSFTRQHCGNSIASGSADPILQPGNVIAQKRAQRLIPGGR